MSKNTHPAVYFRNVGVLNNSDARDAVRFQAERSYLYNYSADLFVKHSAGSPMVFNSIDCIPFIDWAFETGVADNPRIASFVRVVANHALRGMVRRMIKSSNNYRQALIYHTDLVSSLMISTLYGGSPVRVVKAVSLTDDGEYLDRIFRLKNGRFVMATNRRHAMRLNGVYRCAYRDSIMLAWPIISEGYVAIRETSVPGIYGISGRTEGRKENKHFVPALSYWDFCRVIVRANALYFDMGREFEYAHDSKLTEVSDSRNARRSIFGYWSVSHLIDHARKSGEFTEFELLVVKVIYGLESGNFVDSLQTSKRTWARLKQQVETRFVGWARRQIE